MAKLSEKKIISDPNEPPPVPPRYWWAKRIFPAALAVWAALVCCHVWWGKEAHQRMNAEIDRLISAGEPIYPSDFDPPTIPHERNAAKLFLAAEAALHFTPNQSEIVTKLGGKYEKIHNRMDEVEPIVQAATKALELVRRAGEIKDANWGTRFRSPVINAMTPNLTVHRNMSKLLSIVVTYHAKHGNDTQALKTLLDAVRFCHVVDLEPSLIGHLVSIACRTRSIRDVEYLTPTLSLGREKPQRASGSANTNRKLVTLLIAKLLDETDFHAAFKRAMQAERMLFLDTVATGLRSTPQTWRVAWGPSTKLSWSERLNAFPLIPLFDLDTLHGIQFCTDLVRATEKLNWPDTLAALPMDPSTWSPLERHSRPFSVVILRSLGRVFKYRYRLVAETRMAAIAMAIHLYKLDHGRMPDELNKLVPNYLPAIPLDPFSSEARPIGYALRAPKPLLYSVGENGSDDEGAYTLSTDGSVDLAALDLPFFLNGDRPRRKRESNTDANESGEGNNDSDEVERDGGDSEQNQPG